MPQAHTQHAVDVVVIDDEESIREGCRQALEGEGYHTLVADDGRRGLKLVQESRPKLVLVDLRMPEVGGAEVLERLSEIDPDIVAIVITGFGTVDSAVSSMKLGAFDFIAKPFDTDQLLDAVSRGLERRDEPVLRARPELKLVPPPRPRTEADVLLKGLEVLRESYALGIRDQSLSSKLAALKAEARHHDGRLGEIHQEERAIADLLADLELVDDVISEHEFKKNATIQILLDVQASKHWLPHHILVWISKRMNMSLGRLYSIASFYEAFSLTPQGAHTVQVCTGTACHVRKSAGLLSMVSSVLGIGPGETDRNMNFTLKTVNCLGCCALAPVMRVDEQYYSNPSLKEMRTIFGHHTESEETPWQS